MQELNKYALCVGNGRIHSQPIRVKSTYNYLNAKHSQFVDAKNIDLGVCVKYPTVRIRFSWELTENIPIDSMEKSHTHTVFSQHWYELILFLNGCNAIIGDKAAVYWCATCILISGRFWMHERLSYLLISLHGIVFSTIYSIRCIIGK